MKKRKLFTSLLLGLAVVSGLAACDNGSKPEPTKTNPPVVEPTKTETKTETETNSEAKELASYKKAALTKLDELVYAYIAKLPNDALKNTLQSFYDSEKEYINSIVDLETAKNAANQIANDVKDYLKKTLKPAVADALNSIFNPLIEAIPDAELKKSVQEFYNTEMQKLESVDTIAAIPTTYNEILNDTKEYLADEIEKILIALKNKALEVLDPYVEALINKIPFEVLKTDTQAFYTKEKKKLDDVNEIDGFQDCIDEIKDDLEEYVLSEAKKIAIDKLDEIVDEALDKLPNESIKNDLADFEDTEIEKLNAIEKIEDVSSTLSSVLLETEAYIRQLLIDTVKDYIARLTAIETATAYDYLPTAMSPEYSKNIVSESDINYDFTSFTKVSDINVAGYGEQWQMVVENINQSVTMSKVFNVAQTTLNAAGNMVDIYLENSYEDEMSYSFEKNGFTALFEFKNNKLIFNINITSDTEVPLVGTVKPVIKMEYDLANDAKGMFISLGDAYKIKYVVRPDAYEMATTYGVNIAGHSGSRTSYLSVSNTKDATTNNEKTVGHIYEYTTLDESDKISACADFYVENGYVSVVGNKASGMVLFDGYINELYKADEGRLLGYEVKEEKTVLGVTGAYHTLWFNLRDISGINNIKVTDKSDDNESSRSTVDVYLNGSSSLFVPTYNEKGAGFVIVKTSRKYDIEYRSRFYYTRNSQTDAIEVHEVQVPMMFIQAGSNLNDFSSDINTDNGLNSSVMMATNDLNKILDDHDNLIRVFESNKENMSSEKILAYLKQYE